MTKYDENRELKCSFCGKPQSQVKRLISGSGVYICNECVGLCQDIIADEERASAKHAPQGQKKSRKSWTTM